jgi:anti-sigma factor RsiW
MHLDDERVQRFLHGELASPAEHSVREHLAVCPECAQRLAEARRDEHEVHALLRALDHPLPSMTADRLVAGVEGRHPSRLRLAAGIALVLGVAGVAYAAPGSPVRGWLRTAAQWIHHHPAPLPVTPSGEVPGVSGIAVSPGSKLVIVFTFPQPEEQADVSLTDGNEVVVRTLGGVATYSSDVDRLVIGNRDSSSNFTIQIPRAAPRVEIRVGNSRIFLKEGPRISLAPSAGTREHYLLPLRLPSP